MNTPPRSALKSHPRTTGQPRAATLTAVPPVVGAPKVVAEGVPSALRPDPHTAHRDACPLRTTQEGRNAA